jgi:hypothetical protein
MLKFFLGVLTVKLKAIKKNYLIVVEYKRVKNAIELEIYVLDAMSVFIEAQSIITPK